MSAIDDLLANAAGFRREGPPKPAPPARGVAVLTCMDARIDPAALLGLAEGDAHVVRNAGGLATEDAIRSIAISQAALGTRAVMVVQHTRCGLAGTTDEALAETVEQAAGTRPDWRPGAFPELEQSVREQVRALRESPYLAARDEVRGFVYDVDAGELREIG